MKIADIRTSVTNVVAFITPFFETLVQNSHVTEYLMDATYKTNQPGYDLYAVLASVRGAGFPVAYMLVKNQIGVKDAQSNAVMKFLKELKDRGLRPRFFHTDKDWSQINAIRTLWPEDCYVRLCAWHRSRSVRMLILSLHISETFRKPPINAIYRS